MFNNNVYSWHEVPMNQDRQKEQLDYRPTDDFSAPSESPIVLAERRAAIKVAEIRRNIIELSQVIREDKLQAGYDSGIAVQETSLIDTLDLDQKENLSNVKGSLEDSRTWLWVKNTMLAKAA